MVATAGVSEAGVAVAWATVVDDSTEVQDELAQPTAAPASAALQAALAQSATPYRKLAFEHKHSDVTGTQPVVVCMLLIQFCCIKLVKTALITLTRSLPRHDMVKTIEVACEDHFLQHQIFIAT